MPTAFATKPEEKKKTQTTPESQAESSLFPEHVLGAAAGIPMFLQAKLSICPPDDPYEREADRVADRVMRMPEGSSSTHALSLTSAAASTAQPRQRPRVCT